VGAVSGVAGALGPSVGSFLVDRFGWPWAFFLNLPLGALALWQGWRVLDESRDPERGAPLDLVERRPADRRRRRDRVRAGAIEALGWASPKVALAIAGGLAMLAAFVAWARTARAPAIDLSLFQDRTYRYINLASLCFAIGFAMMFFQTFRSPRASGRTR
jgi:MFS family permease